MGIQLLLRVFGIFVVITATILAFNLGQGTGFTTTPLMVGVYGIIVAMVTILRTYVGKTRPRVASEAHLVAGMMLLVIAAWTISHPVWMVGALILIALKGVLLLLPIKD
jgi:hypothetical protein